VIRRALLVVNPAARRAARDERAVVAAFAAAGVPCVVVRTERAGHAAELARAAFDDAPGGVPAAAAPPDAVFTLGGDGTAMEVVGALAGRGIPVGLLPAGTGNLVARTLGIPLQPAHAVRALLAGRPARVDLGLVESAGAAPRHFAFAAGIGVDATMIERTPARWKRRVGVLAYALAAARAVVAGERFAVTVEVERADGSVETLAHDAASAVMIVNFGAVLGDLFRFGPGIRHDDGVLDCCLFTPRGFGDAARAMWRLVRKDFRDDPALRYRAGVAFTVRVAPARRVQADGELLGATPIRVRVLPDAATLLVPAPDGADA
jgi:diacylglycerol kinase family enzyme